MFAQLSAQLKWECLDRLIKDLHELLEVGEGATYQPFPNRVSDNELPRSCKTLLSAWYCLCAQANQTIAT